MSEATKVVVGTLAVWANLGLLLVAQSVLA